MGEIVVVDNFCYYPNVKEEAPIHLDLAGKSLLPGAFTRLLYDHFRQEYPEHPELAMNSKTCRRTIYLKNLDASTASRAEILLFGEEIAEVASGMPWRIILK